MSGSDVWGGDHDGAWAEFAGEVTRSLAEEGFGIVEVEVLTGGQEVDGCRPWVSVSEEDGAFAAGVSGNDLLAAGHRLDARGEELLRAMGFREQERGDDGQRWFYRDAGPDDLDLLVGLVVRALREVFGVVHPAFLDWDGGSAAPGGAEPVLGPRPGRDAAPARPASPGELEALVDDVVAVWLGYDPVKDDDGDIPIVRGESMAFVQVCPSQPRVDLFSVVVRDVRHRGAARREVNLLNRKCPGLTFWVAGDRVLMRSTVSAAPFVGEHLSAALDDCCRQLDVVARDLAERVGGVLFLTDDSEGVP